MAFIPNSVVRTLPDHETLRVVVPRGLVSEIDLLRILSAGLDFPAYSGRNWDALFDLLCDFSWTAKPRIVIEHEDVPALPPPHREIYLNLLADAVGSWQINPGAHTLVVAFPDDVISAWANEPGD